jgi:membrane protein required for colicin V production
LNNIAAVDWIFLMVLVASLLLGAWRGLVYEMLSLLSWIAAFALAQWLALDAAGWLPLGSSPDQVRYVVGFLLVFIPALFAGGLIASLMQRVVSSVGLRPVDRVSGAVFGTLRGVVLLMAVTVVVGMTPVHSSDAWKEADGPLWAAQLLGSLKPVLPAEFINYLPRNE